MDDKTFYAAAATAAAAAITSNNDSTMWRWIKLYIWTDRQTDRQTDRHTLGGEYSTRAIANLSLGVDITSSRTQRLDDGQQVFTTTNVKCTGARL